jgi:Protein of unknown function (DUF2630)
MPTDDEISDQIDQLEQERSELRRREGEQDPEFAQDAARLAEIQVDLDQLWDLLRQRRALRAAGRNPDDAHERSARVVERYWQ